VKDFGSLLPNFPEFKKKIEFLDGLSIFNYKFEPLTPETKKISSEDKKILQEVFETGKPYSIETNNKFKIYTSWRIDEASELFRPVGVILTLNTSPIHNLNPLKE